MSSFELTYLADQDLEGIALYTLERWDEDQADKYLSAFDTHFEEIAEGYLHTRSFFKHRDDVRFSKCQKHVVFHLVREDEPPLILAVFHESMELMSRLKNRLEELD
ncbi:Plasmid stabilization system protein ParE [Rubritalea squalenifaciens DSM 18772]|uniref:Plasmid stabilization system protein ParE n=1 Tax=Rubritalea squalenifaciens DSM 18772 TaxID=1123071 RepID=A0A1M6RAB1_9BACT|nr:type II toxin-antitoxin system RelE/ParE family toxin [Rubritalea squalenifaciens]SHK29382.1 Plasmid stabilization system protein ParE [Rubritalea squalenifaciens DSM 18772]